MLCDVPTGIVINIQMYIGKIEGKAEINQGSRVVRDLIYPHLKRGLPVDIVADNFFISLKLGYFLAQYNGTILGTIRSSRKEVPSVFTTKREKKSNTIYSSKGRAKILSYKTQKGKNVLLMTTRFENEKIFLVKSEKDGEMKPTPVLQYNATMGGVDAADASIKSFSCRRKTNRWNMRVLFDIIDISALNAFKIYHHFHPKSDRRSFNIDLANGLAPSKEKK